MEGWRSHFPDAVRETVRATLLAAIRDRSEPLAKLTDAVNGFEEQAYTRSDTKEAYLHRIHRKAEQLKKHPWTGQQPQQGDGAGVSGSLGGRARAGVGSGPAHAIQGLQQPLLHQVQHLAQQHQPQQHHPQPSFPPEPQPQPLHPQQQPQQQQHQQQQQQQLLQLQLQQHQQMSHHQQLQGQQQLSHHHILQHPQQLQQQLAHVRPQAQVQFAPASAVRPLALPRSTPVSLAHPTSAYSTSLLADHTGASLAGHTGENSPRATNPSAVLGDSTAAGIQFPAAAAQSISSLPITGFGSGGDAARGLGGDGVRVVPLQGAQGGPQVAGSIPMGPPQQQLVAQAGAAVYLGAGAPPGPHYGPVGQPHKLQQQQQQQQQQQGYPQAVQQHSPSQLQHQRQVQATQTPGQAAQPAGQVYNQGGHQDVKPTIERNMATMPPVIGTPAVPPSSGRPELGGEVRITDEVVSKFLQLKALYEAGVMNVVQTMRLRPLNVPLGQEQKYTAILKHVEQLALGLRNSKPPPQWSSLEKLDMAERNIRKVVNLKLGHQQQPQQQQQHLQQQHHQQQQHLQAQLVQDGTPVRQQLAPSQVSSAVPGQSSAHPHLLDHQLHHPPPPTMTQQQQPPPQQHQQRQPLPQHLLEQLRLRQQEQEPAASELASRTLAVAAAPSPLFGAGPAQAPVSAGQPFSVEQKPQVMRPALLQAQHAQPTAAMHDQKPGNQEHRQQHGTQPSLLSRDVAEAFQKLPEMLQRYVKNLTVPQQKSILHKLAVQLKQGVTMDEISQKFRLRAQQQRLQAAQQQQQQQQQQLQLPPQQQQQHQHQQQQQLLPPRPQQPPQQQQARQQELLLEKTPLAQPRPWSPAPPLQGRPPTPQQKSGVQLGKPHPVAAALVQPAQTMPFVEGQQGDGGVGGSSHLLLPQGVKAGMVQQQHHHHLRQQQQLQHQQQQLLLLQQHHQQEAQQQHRLQPQDSRSTEQQSSFHRRVKQEQRDEEEQQPQQRPQEVANEQRQQGPEAHLVGSPNPSVGSPGFATGAPGYGVASRAIEPQTPDDGPAMSSTHKLPTPPPSDAFKLLPSPFQAASPTSQDPTVATPPPAPRADRACLATSTPHQGAITSHPGATVQSGPPDGVKGSDGGEVGAVKPETIVLESSDDEDGLDDEVVLVDERGMVHVDQDRLRAAQSPAVGPATTTASTTTATTLQFVDRRASVPPGVRSRSAAAPDLTTTTRSRLVALAKAVVSDRDGLRSDGGAPSKGLASDGGAQAGGAASATAAVVESAVSDSTFARGPSTGGWVSRGKVETRRRGRPRQRWRLLRSLGGVVVEPEGGACSTVTDMDVMGSEADEVACTSSTRRLSHRSKRCRTMASATPETRLRMRLALELDAANTRLVDVVAEVGEDATREAASEGRVGCGVLVTYTGPLHGTVISPLRLLVPLSYPACSPTVWFDYSASGFTLPTSSAVRDSFSTALLRLSKPVSVEDMARTWEQSARSVLADAATSFGGGSFTPTIGCWHFCSSPMA